MLEQSDTPSEQDGYQIDVYLVEEIRSDPPLRDAHGAHSHVLVASDRFRLLDDAFDTIGDERERRSFVDLFFNDSPICHP